MTDELRVGERATLDTGTDIKRGKGDHANYFRILASGLDHDDRERRRPAILSKQEIAQLALLAGVTAEV